MSDKKNIKISLSSFFLIIAIIIILIMGYAIYRLYAKKSVAETQVDNLNSKIESLESQVDGLQTTINSVSAAISNGTNSNTSNVNQSSNTNNTTDTEAINTKCKTTLDKYLNLIGTSEGSPENLLVELNLLTTDKFEKLKNNSNENYIKTSVKYEDLKNAMLDYVTEDFFETNFEKNDNYKNSNGYVSVINGGGSGISYTIKNFELKSKSNNIYKYNVTYTYEPSNGETKTLSATFTYLNGKYLISDIAF